MARILLINPPYPVEEAPAPPMGLLYLATYMKERGHDVRITDYVVNRYSEVSARRTVHEFKPHIVGSTGVTMNIKKAIRIIKDFKTIDPAIYTVMGGPHVTFDAEQVLLENPEVDFIVRREGEITFEELAGALVNGSDAGAILGLSYRHGANIIHNEDRPLIANINILPVPDRSLIELNKYRALNLPINMITSRGCPHKCIFCVGSKMVGKKVRYFDTTRVVDEFEMLASLGFNQINIVDDLFTSNKKRCIDICDEIARRGINKKWSAFARVDTINEDVMRALSRAHCTDLCFGIESGNQEILDRVKKKITLEMVRNAVQLCRQTGIRPLASYILGLPGETHETIRETMAFADSMAVPYGFHVLAPFPGSEVRESCAEYGVRIMTDDWDRYDANQSVCDLDSISYQDIDRIYQEQYDRCTSLFARNLEQYKAGETLSEADLYLVRNFIDFNFVYTLVSENLLEQYDEYDKKNGRDVLDDLSVFIAQHSTIQYEEALSQINRLLQCGYIARIKTGEGETVTWVS